MWKFITKEVNYHYYHFPFRLASLVRKKDYITQQRSKRKSEGKNLCLSLNTCLFVCNSANHEIAEWDLGNGNVAVSPSQHTCQSLFKVATFTYTPPSFLCLKHQLKEEVTGAGLQYCTWTSFWWNCADNTQKWNKDLFLKMLVIFFVLYIASHYISLVMCKMFLIVI